MKKKYLVIGAGFSGAVLAEQLAGNKNASVLVIEERDHVGGNCYTEKDSLTGIIVHKYGPHVFYTDNERTWKYISGFCKLVPYINRVKAVYNGEAYSIPINLHTINQFFRKSLDPGSARIFLDKLIIRSGEEPKNFEELALATIGRELYQAFYYSYTRKQWGCEPSCLPVDVLKRLPVRYNYNDNYYDYKYQGIPDEGYTPIFDKMLNKPGIEVQLNTKFLASYPHDDFDHVFYTGPVDAFFNFKFGRLGYRTVSFVKDYADGDFQGNAVINYTDDSVAFTRIHEHKHFMPWKEYDKTIFFREYSKETGENDDPFYPRRLPDDMRKLNMYHKEVKKLKGFTFLGRLATYRYMDMHHVIDEALETASVFLRNKSDR